MASLGSKLNEKLIREVIELPQFLLDSVVEWIQGQLSPEDVFDKTELENWAYDNGFRKVE